MIRTFRYPLQPTKAQETVLSGWLPQLCMLFNAALEQRREAWRKQRASIGLYRQQKELTALRANDPVWAAIPAWVARSALARVERTFMAYFRRVRAGEHPGYPRFRSPKRYDTFTLGTVVPSVYGNRVYIPAIGLTKFRKYREIRGTIRHVTISRAATGWSISFNCEIGAAPSKVPITSAVGVDLGLEALATLSNGDRVANPRYLRAGADLIARRHRAVARTRPLSNGRKKARRCLAKAYGHIRNQRLEFARKVASVLFERFDLIVHENLEIARLARGLLSKSVRDVAWGVLLRALSFKAENAGKWCVAVDSAGTSQICSGCGIIVKKELSEREHRCDCGLVLHRDHNAALNILARGVRAGQLTEAPWGQPCIA
jgi:putative transposase